MTSFAHGISLATEESTHFLGLQVDGAQARAASAADSGSFRVFSLACSFKMTRRWTFFTASLRSCSRSSVSWFGKESWQKKVGFPVSSALHFLRINSFKFRLKQTSRCRQQKLQIVPELFKLGNIHLEVCINIPQPFADASVRNRHQVQGGRL